MHYAVSILGIIERKNRAAGENTFSKVFCFIISKLQPASAVWRKGVLKANKRTAKSGDFAPKSGPSRVLREDFAFR